MKFEDINKINVSEHIEKKKQSGVELSYLSWTYAISEFKKIYPDFTYEVKKFDNGKGVLLPYMYDESTGYMVMTSITADGLTQEMWLPVMDGANKSMKKEPYKYTTKYGEKSVEACSMFDINKTIMRCLVKNMAMFGLGLYIYAGEDLPETEPVTLPEEIKNAISNCKTVEELQTLYNANKGDVSKELMAEFNSLVTKKKKELNNANS